MVTVLKVVLGVLIIMFIGAALYFARQNYLAMKELEVKDE